MKSISRRLNIASQDLNNVSGPEDIQNIALTCRESLIELAKVLADDNPNLLKDNNLKAAYFKDVAQAVADAKAKTFLDILIILGRFDQDRA